MSIDQSKVFINENGTQVYLKECKKHGLGYHYITTENNKPRYRCCECSKETSQKRDTKKERQTKTQQIVDYMGGCCIICGYNKSNYSLECHHEDPTKKEHTIAQLKNKKWDTILKEIDKCILVCSNCHRDIHSQNEILDNIANRHNWKFRKLIYQFNEEKCFICGNNSIYNVAYHHIDPSIKCFTISDGIATGKSLEEITNECKKCVLLCHNCHREYHYDDNYHQDVQFISTFKEELYQEYLLEEEKNKEPKNICKQCGKKTNNDTYCSYECSHISNRKVDRPSKEELSILIENNTYDNIGKMFGVSGNAVKKWIKKYELVYIPKKSIPPKHVYKPFFTKEELKNELQYLSMQKIADKYNIGLKRVKTNCEYYGLKSSWKNQYE